MGEVYRARDTRIDRIVAIKLRPTHIASDVELRERFHRGSSRDLPTQQLAHLHALR
jgi:hypothetical protein